MDPVRLQPLRQNQSSSHPDNPSDLHAIDNDHKQPEDTNMPYSTPQPEKKESFLGEIFKFALIALVIVLPFRFYVAQPFIVNGASMSPTFETGQYLIVDQISYRFHEPARGDVIIFKFPEDTSKFFIKRVIGLPNETVELRGTDVIVRDSEGDQIRIDEPYLLSANLKEDFLTITLGEHEYFVMGDNRAASSDSRIWGAVPENLIVGRAFVRLLPLSDVSLYPGQYAIIGPDQLTKKTP